MADQEVIKHTKKIYKIWNSKEHSFWHKAKEFVLEIFIIVFAVSLSIWLHGRSEHSHQQAETHEFLTGLREDLESDAKEMTADRNTYINTQKAFRYLVSLRLGEQVSLDSVKKYKEYLFNNTELIPNNGRFEGFKSSGKIGSIEDPKLQNNIMDLYQEDIPFLIRLTSYNNTAKDKFKDYFNTKLKMKSDTEDNFQEVMATDQARNLAWGLKNQSAVIDQYSKCIKKISVITHQIDSLYH